MKSDKRIADASKKWELERLRLLSRHGTKEVYAGESRRYGSVILKRNTDLRELQREYRMLSRLDCAQSVRAYGFDGEVGLLLEERILPGTTLRKEISPEKRVRCLSGVFHAIHAPADGGTTYLDWLRGIVEYCECNPVPGELSRMAGEAYGICRELFRRYPERLLLHGDLHHDNLLKRADGSYAMIDPKGIAGPEILDLPRFLLNETDAPHEGGLHEHMEKMIRLLAEEFGFPDEDLGNAFYMEAVLAGIWNLEDGGEVETDTINFAASFAAAGSGGL